jgi:hypothetical protein
MRLVEDDAAGHRAGHPEDDDDEPDAAGVLLSAGKVFYDNRIEQRRDGVEHAHVKTVSDQEQNVTWVRHETLDRTEVVNRIVNGGVDLGLGVVGSGGVGVRLLLLTVPQNFLSARRRAARAIFET